MKSSLVSSYKIFTRFWKENGQRERKRQRGANTNSFPFDIRAREKSVRFIKFRENVRMPTNPPPRSPWHPSIVFLGILINIYECGRATRSRLEAISAFPSVFWRYVRRVWCEAYDDINIEVIRLKTSYSYSFLFNILNIVAYIYHLFIILTVIIYIKNY